MLDDAYRECRRITARHGRSYYLAARLLPAQHRRAVHALYAFARTVDDIVDHPGEPDVPARLDEIETALTATFDPNGPLGSPLTALGDTVRRYEIPHEYFSAFLRSMRMDVPQCAEFRDRYASMAQLREYMYGSAAVIGLQLLPVLGTVVPQEEAAPAAAALGEAFQLTNFLRDVGEDLDRGRIYLPADELAAFGVDDELLRYCRATGHIDRRVRRALAHLIAVTRGIYREAEPGIGLLSPSARPGIAAAFTLYSAILDRIEHTGYTVFQRRTVVPGHRRVALAASVAIDSLTATWSLGKPPYPIRSDRPEPGAAPHARGARATPLPASLEGSRLR